jgi:type I restriction enzyme, S subunit
MRDGWRNVALGELLDLDIEKVVVDSEARYLLAGVYSFGRGIFERESLLGLKTSYRALHRLRPGRLVMSKLKAWEGALAVVPSRFDGFIVSPEFPTFRTRDDLDPAYLGLLCSQPWFWQLLQDQSQGMGGRRERVHPRRFLEVRVPLPPIPEQRRVVDLISAVDTVVDAASTVMLAAKSLLVAHLRSAFGGGTLLPLRSVIWSRCAQGRRGRPCRSHRSLPTIACRS